MKSFKKEQRNLLVTANWKVFSCNNDWLDVNNDIIFMLCVNLVCHLSLLIPYYYHCIKNKHFVTGLIEYYFRTLLLTFSFSCKKISSFINNTVNLNLLTSLPYLLTVFADRFLTSKLSVFFLFITLIISILLRPAAFHFEGRFSLLF